MYSLSGGKSSPRTKSTPTVPPHTDHENQNVLNSTHPREVTTAPTVESSTPDASVAPRPLPRIAVGLPLRPRHTRQTSPQRKKTIAVGLPTIAEDEATMNLISTLVANDMQQRLKHGSSGRVETTAAEAMTHTSVQRRTRSVRVPSSRTASHSETTPRDGAAACPGVCTVTTPTDPGASLHRLLHVSTESTKATVTATVSPSHHSTEPVAAHSHSSRSSRGASTAHASATATRRTTDELSQAATTAILDAKQWERQQRSSTAVVTTRAPLVRKQNAIRLADQRVRQLDRSHSFTSDESDRKPAAAHVENPLNRVLEHVGRTAESGLSTVHTRHATLMDEKRQARHTLGHAVARAPLVHKLASTLEPPSRAADTDKRVRDPTRASLAEPRPSSRLAAPLPGSTMDEAKRMIREQRGIANVVPRTPPARLQDATVSSVPLPMTKGLSDKSMGTHSRGSSDLSSSDHSRRSVTKARGPPAKSQHEQMLHDKRVERERLAAAAAVPRTTTHDAMGHAKRAARATTAAMVPRQRKASEVVTSPGTSSRGHGFANEGTGSSSDPLRRYQPASQRVLDRTLSNNTRLSQGDDDDLSTSSAYALAMARTSMQSVKEANKLREYESGPSLAPATNGEVHPGAFALVGRELSTKEYEPTPTPSVRGSHSPESSHHENNEVVDDIEPLPVVFPGAFAVQGLTNQDSESEFSSSSESDDVESGGLAHQNESQALQAELYEEVVLLEGSVVAPIDGENTLDSKALKRLRMIQVAIFCFSLGAIGLIVGGVLRFSDKKSDKTPVVVGWRQVGQNLFGPTEEPLTLFGSSLALSGNGKRVAIASPGVDVDTALNAGAVYLMEETQGENGTEWAVLQIINGPGASTEAHVAVSMSQNGTWLAVGNPHLSDGSLVQVYKEQDGVWNPTTQALTGPEGVSTWFGYSVDLSADGSILAIGAPTTDGPFGSESGVVQVYQASGDSWVPMGSDIGGANPNELFGWSISICGQDGFRVAVGAPVALDTAGLVRVFDWNGVEWTQSGSDLLGETPLNRFGESVSLSHDGKVLAIGARGSAFEPGQVHIFRDIDGEWVLDQSKLSGKQPGEGFGSSVSLSSDGAVLGVGSPQSSIYSDAAGILSIFQYDKEAGMWSQEGSAIGSDTTSHLGGAIAVSPDGKRVVGGAPTTAFVGSVSRAGAVLVYDRDKNVTGS